MISAGRANPKRRIAVIFLEYRRQVSDKIGHFDLAAVDLGVTLLAIPFERIQFTRLANAFDELTDGQEQRKRFDQWQTERLRLGKKPFPQDETFFDAVDALPPTVGIALGLDRLMALAMGSKSLVAVRPFKLDELLEKR